MVKNVNGGYALIDLSGTDLTAGSKVTLTGMYKSLERAKKSLKPVIACNVVNGSNNPVTPTPISISMNDTDIEAVMGVNKITVDSDDGVTVSSLVTSNANNAKSTRKA